MPSFFAKPHNDQITCKHHRKAACGTESNGRNQEEANEEKKEATAAVVGLSDGRNNLFVSATNINTRTEPV
jgi:hypothetical protein